jgi:cupin 2 domain-containing protein
MPPTTKNLFDSHNESTNEVYQRLLKGSAFHMDQIISHGVCSPSEFWYDQNTEEWVLLLRGEATLQFADGELQLRPGDSLIIRPHLKHRVARTTTDAVWLAIHYAIGEQPNSLD